MTMQAHPDTNPATKTEVLILVFVGLITALGVAFMVFKGVGRPIDGEALLAERFGAEDWPLDLEVEMAHKLGSGDRVVRLARAPGSELGDDVPEVVVVQFVGDIRAAKLHFPSEVRMGDPMAEGKWEEDPSQAFRKEITRGRVRFGAFEGLYIRDRLFRDTGEWVDSMRVNLSASEPPCVLFAEFAPGVDGTEEGFEALLEGLDVKSPGL